MLGSFDRDLPIRVRVLTILAVVTLLSVGTVGAVSYQLGVGTLRQQAIDQLTVARELKARQIESYFRIIRDQLVTLSENRMVIDALREFTAAASTLDGELGAGPLRRSEIELGLRLHYQEEFLPRLQAGLGDAGSLSDHLPGDDLAVSLQHLYISENPFDVGSKQLLDAAEAGTRYDRVHERYHPLFRTFLDRFGYYDLFLVSAADHRVVYSVYKEIDFGTSLESGPHRGSNLAQAYRVGRGLAAPSDARLVDFGPYVPSYGAQASFIASPVVDGDELLGVLVFQMPLSRINETMTNGGAWGSMGFGETGEAYLVGPDQTLRTESRFLVQDRDRYLEAIRDAGMDEGVVRAIEAQGSAVGLQPVRTEGVRLALAGETGVSRFRDYRGVQVFSSFRPLDIQDLDWVLMSEKDVSEAMAPVGSLARRMLIVLAVLLPVLGLLALWFAANLIRPIRALSVSANALASGDLDQSVAVERGDEVGDLARSFESMRLSLRRLIDRQNRSIEALSTPLIPIRDDVVVLPIVGELDPARCDRLRDSLTGQLHASGARVAILDLTGVTDLDLEVAEGLVGIARSVRLLGAQAIISGVQPEVALRMADGGVGLEGVATARTLREAIETAVEQRR
jgi:methyl-accepting chemotaxis protein